MAKAKAAAADAAEAPKKKAGAKHAVFQQPQGAYHVGGLAFERGRVYEISDELAAAIEGTKPAPAVKVFGSREEAEANRAELEAQWAPKQRTAA